MRFFIHGDEKTSQVHVDEFIKNITYFVDPVRIQVIKGEQPSNPTMFDVDICLTQDQTSTRVGTRLKLNVDSNPSDVAKYCTHLVVQTILNFARDLNETSQLKYEKDGRTYCDKDCTMLHSFDDQPAFIEDGTKYWYQCGMPKRAGGKPVFESEDGNCSMHVNIRYN